MAFDTADRPLLELLAALKRDGYDFVTPTPVSHARVVGRSDRRRARSLRDILGWSLPFDRALPDPAILAALEVADMIEPVGDALRSRVRVSSLHGDLFLHSAFPTTAPDAVFFGPDSYRFASLIRDEFLRDQPGPGAHIVDLGTGTGVGAIVADRAMRDARLTMTDINSQALRFARINIAAAGLSANLHLGTGLSMIADPVDVVLANPPYIVDAEGRDYRDGGAMHGGAVALDMARLAVERLSVGGRLILYTGSAIIDGADPLRDEFATVAKDGGCTMRYREIDPDVFGEELAGAAYADVERIAAVAAIFERTAVES
ncbi:MAG: class I SAM-dependent methyltransferase [Pseudomonadota bacterium]